MNAGQETLGASQRHRRIAAGIRQRGPCSGALAGPDGSARQRDGRDGEQVLRGMPGRFMPTFEEPMSLGMGSTIGVRQHGANERFRLC